MLSKIKPRHAEAFIAHRLSTVPSVSTVNKDIRTLQRIFNLAIEPRGYLSEGQNPFAKIKQRKKPRISNDTLLLKNIVPWRMRLRIFGGML